MKTKKRKKVKPSCQMCEELETEIVGLEDELNEANEQAEQAEAQLTSVEEQLRDILRELGGKV